MVDQPGPDSRRKAAVLASGVIGGLILILVSGHASQPQPNNIGIFGMALTGISGGFLVNQWRFGDE